MNDGLNEFAAAKLGSHLQEEPIGGTQTWLYFVELAHQGFGPISDKHPTITIRSDDEWIYVLYRSSLWKDATEQMMGPKRCISRDDNYHP